MTEKKHILDIQQAGLQNGLKELGLPKFRAKQIWQWIYEKGVLDPAEMSNIGKADVEKLAEKLDFSLFEVSEEQVAQDGTVKWLFKMPDGHEIETVFIPERGRGTLCVSSQVGCTLNCRFCHTGTQGFARNLSTAEIVGQVWMARHRLGKLFEEGLRKPYYLHKSEGRKRILTNIVFMGMGEPLYNWDNVRDACKILMDESGFAFGSRKITISTSGMVKNLPKIGEELGVQLAISIHAPDNDTRTKIMPVNIKWPVEELIQAIRDFPLKAHRRVTFEYVMLDGVNDSEWHAHRLVRLIKHTPSFVNIIPFNEWPGSPFKCSPQKKISEFAHIIEQAEIAVNVRRSRGEDILAACGQLRGETSSFNSISLQYPSVVAEYGTEKQKALKKIKVDIQEAD